MRRLSLLLVALVAFAVAGLSGALGWAAQFALAGGAYLIAGGLVGRAAGSARQLWAHSVLLAAPWAVIYAAPVLWSGQVQVHPIALVAPVAVALGAAAGFAHRRRPRAAVALVALSAAAIVAVSVVGMPNWFNATIRSKAFLGETEFPAPEISFATADGSALDLRDLRGTVVVLDFWTTYCAVCFDSFPLLERLHDRYAEDSRVRIFAVNLPAARDKPGQARKMLESHGFRFAALYATEPEEIVGKAFRIRAVPTAVVIDREGIVRYHGWLETAPWVFVGNLQHAVDRALTRPARGT